MNQLPPLPPALAAVFTATYGPTMSVESLSGMSPATVARVRFANASVIVKVSPSPRETLVYERLGPAMRAAGVQMPELLWSAHLPDGHWLVIEDLPHAVPIQPREAWRPDARMVALLLRLHRLDLQIPPALLTIDPPAWTDAMNDAALTIFPAETARALTPMLRSLQDESRQRRTPSCWLSGDPNPNNWGMRADGTLVLFDWERLRRGPPAFDLAILVPGLGDPAQYARLADAYLAAQLSMAVEPRTAPAALSRDIALGKALSVVEFLTHWPAATRTPRSDTARRCAPSYRRG